MDENPLDSLPSYSAPEPPARRKAYLWRILLLGWVIFLLILCAYMMVRALLSDDQPSNTQAATSEPPSLKSIPLTDLKAVDNSTTVLEVKGRLKVDNSIVLTPGGAPENPVVGQVYYDSKTNAPYYYNGDKFVAVANQDAVTVLQETTQQQIQVQSEAISALAQASPKPGDTIQSGQANVFKANNQFNGTVTILGVATLQSASISNLLLSHSLGVESGGTGARSFSANGVVIGNGSGALSAITAASTGLCFISTNGAPSFQACPSGTGGVANAVTSTLNTSGSIAKFGPGNIIIDSLLSESGSTVAVNGSLNLTNGNQYRINGTQISSSDLANNADLAKLGVTQLFTGATQTFRNTVDSSSALLVQNAASRNILSVNSTAGSVTLGNVTSISGQGLAGSLLFADGTNDNFAMRLNTTTLSASHTITLPNASGTVCLQNSSSCGFITGTPADFVQSQNVGAQNLASYWIAGVGRADSGLLGPSFDVATMSGTLAIGNANAETINIGTNDKQHVINIGTGATTQWVSIGSPLYSSSLALQSGGLGILMNSYGSVRVDTSEGFSVGNQTSDNYFDINTSTGVIQTAWNTALNIQGSALFERGISLGSGSGLTYTSPLGTALGTKINIPNYTLSEYGTIIALGLTNTSPSSARAIMIADQRSGVHQPTIGVLSPDENDLFGFSWDGHNTIATLKTLGTNSNIEIKPGNVGIASFNNWTGLTLNTGNTTNTILTVQGSAYAYGGFISRIFDGSAGDNSTLTVGKTNAPAVQVGRDNLNVTSDSWSGKVTMTAYNSFLQAGTGGIVAGRNNGVDSATAFTVQNAANSSVLAVNTLTSAVGVQGSLSVSQSLAAGGDVTIATGKSLKITGDTTANRPASPSEGTVFFDTATKRLLVYANGKWQADRSDAVLVAASDSAQSDKDAADYTADGNTATANDGDQVQINSALTAAAGRKVVLLAGTYIVDGSTFVPNNTTLTGVGQGTVIMIANNFNSNLSVIYNSDSTTGSGVAIQDLKIDGNSSNQTSGNMVGVTLEGLGTGNTQGAKLLDVLVVNMVGDGVALKSSSNSTLGGNTVRSNGGFGIHVINTRDSSLADNITASNGYTGIRLNNSTGNSIMRNITKSNLGNGLQLAGASDINTVSANTIQSNSENGISLEGSSNSTVSGNTVSGSALSGISLTSGANNNVVTANKVYNNGSNGENNGIFLWSVDSNQVTNNNITDTSATNHNFAINLYDSSVNNTYLSSNTLGGGTIYDAGTATLYASQVNNSGSLKLQAATSLELAASTNVAGALTATATVSGTTLQGSTSVLSPLLDRADSGTLSVGTANATAITIGQAGVPTTIAGTLTVNETATFNGAIIVNGHIVSGGGAPSIWPLTAACGSSIVVTDTGSTDTAGAITITPTSSCGQTGLLVGLYFVAPFNISPKVTLTPATAAAASLQVYVGTVSTTAAILSTNTALASGQTYKWYYHVIE